MNTYMQTPPPQISTVDSVIISVRINLLNKGETSIKD